MTNRSNRILFIVVSIGLLCVVLVYAGVYLLNDRFAKRDTVPVPLAERLPSVEGAVIEKAALIFQDRSTPPIRRDWKSYTTAMRGDGIRAMVFDQQGRLWTAGSGGAVRWDFEDQSYAKYTAEYRVPSNNLFSITIAPDGKVWVGGDSAGIATFDGETWEAFRIPRNTWASEVHALYVNPDGTAWAGVTDQGLFNLTESGSDRLVARGAPGSDDDVSAIFKASDGSLWVSNQGNTEQSDSVFDRPGVFRYDGKRWTYYKRADGLGSRVVLGITEGPAGTIWLATGAGLARFDGAGWLNYTTDSGLLDNQVWAVTTARDQAIWAATGKGLSRFDGKAWTNYNLGFAVRTIAQGPDGSIWFSSDHGLHSLTNDVMQTYHTQDYLLGNDITAMDITSTGDIWCRTSQVGLVRYQGDTPTVFKTQDGLVDELVLSIQPAADGVWFGTDNGISFYNGDQWQTVTPPHTGLNRYQVVYADPQGKIWAAAGTKAWVWDGQVWKAVFHREDEVSHTIWAITTGRDGATWFGTSDGVSRFDGQTWRDFSEQDGLPFKHIDALVTARDGSIWAGTSAGISRFDGQNWWSVDQTGELYAGLGQMLAASDGSIWIATLGKVVQFDPQGKQDSFISLHGLGSDIVWDIAEAPDGSIWFATAGGFSQYAPGKKR